MKIWRKNIDVDAFVDSFTVGREREFALDLADADALGSLAHTKMLESIGLLTREELRDIQKELKNIYQQLLDKDFEINESVEDVHSQIEMMLTERIGEAGKKIHSGRSRNDQVLVDLKKYFEKESEVRINKIGK